MDKFDIEVTHRFGKIDIADSEYQSLLRVITWDIEPHFPFPGRTAWFRFGVKPFLQDGSGLYFHAAKIKGVGIWNPPSYQEYSGVHSDEFSSNPLPPLLKGYEYTSQSSHIGFTSTGEYSLVFGDSSPYGGMKYSRALNEYNNAYILYAQHVPSVTPFLVVSWKSLFYENEQLGMVVSLSSEPSPCRLHSVLYGDGVSNCNEYVGSVYRSLEINDYLPLDTRRLTAVNILSRKIGGLMQEFSLAGLYRHSGGWDNFHYCTNTTNVFLTDLDSSKLVSELDIDLRSLYILRDFVSVLYKFFVRLVHPLALKLYSLSDLLRYDPIASMISGYFPLAANDRVFRVSKVLWDYFIPFVEKNKYGNSVDKSNKMDRDFFFVLAMTAIFPIFLESKLGEKYLSPFSENDMLERAKLFLGGRYEYAVYLLSRI